MYLVMTTIIWNNRKHILYNHLILCYDLPCKLTNVYTCRIFVYSTISKTTNVDHLGYIKTLHFVFAYIGGGNWVNFPKNKMYIQIIITTICSLGTLSTQDQKIIFRENSCRRPHIIFLLELKRLFVQDLCWYLKSKPSGKWCMLK